MRREKDSRIWISAWIAAAALATVVFMGVPALGNTEDPTAGVSVEAGTGLDAATAESVGAAAASGDTAINISKAAIGDIKIRTYTGEAFTPEPSVRVKQNGAYVTLKKDMDYTLSYSRNVNAGTAKVIVTGINGYTGTASKDFTINPAPVKTASLKHSSMPYNGEARTQTRSTVVTARVNGVNTVIEKAGNYNITYRNNTEIGTAYLTVTGKGNFTGTIEKTFKIVPAAPGLKSATGATRRFTAKWTQPSGGITGFQLQYSTTRDFSTGVTTKTLRDSGALSGTITSLTAGKTYYVRVRAYKTVDEKRYYSAWCKKKAVTLTVNALTVKGSSAGKRTLILDNAPESLGSVSFAVWSNANGQDDMVWYTAKKTDTGRWYATFKVTKHRNAGTFNVHAYSGGTYLSGQTFSLDASETATEYTELAASLNEAKKRSQLIRSGRKARNALLSCLIKMMTGHGISCSKPQEM